MANVIGPKFLRWDTLSGAASPWRYTKVKKIQVSVPLSGASATVTLTSDGKTFFSEEILPGTMYDMDYQGGQNFKSLAASAIGSGAIVHIEVC